MYSTTICTFFSYIYISNSLQYFDIIKTVIASILYRISTVRYRISTGNIVLGYCLLAHNSCISICPFSLCSI